MARGNRRDGKEKLSRKEKAELRKDYEKTQQQLKTIVLPTIGVCVALIFIYVFIKTRGYSNIAETYDDYE